MAPPIVIERSTLITGMVVGLFLALVAVAIRIDALEADVAYLKVRRPCTDHDVFRSSWATGVIRDGALHPYAERAQYPPDVPEPALDVVEPDRMPPEALVNREALAAFFERQEVPDPAKVVLSTVPREHAKSSP